MRGAFFRVVIRSIARSIPFIVIPRSLFYGCARKISRSARNDDTGGILVLLFLLAELLHDSGVAP